MEAEPPKADRPKRNPRWFQFSRRTLMIGVTLLAMACAYVGWQAKTVHERRWLLDNVILRKSVVVPDLSPAHLTAPLPCRSAPWIRQLLDDVWIDEIRLDANTSDAEFDEIAASFPEAVVKRVH
jgi:hypothetical protein